MDIISKDYLLGQLKIYLIKGLANVEQLNNDDVLINFGKCKFIKDILLRCFNFDLETVDDLKTTYLMRLYSKLYAFIQEV